MSENQSTPHKTAILSNKWFWIIVVAINLLGALIFIGFALNSDEPEEDPTSSYVDSSNIPTITNYEECVAAGYPIMESYPEQCAVPGGETFTRVLSAEEQAALEPDIGDIHDVLSAIGADCSDPIDNRRDCTWQGISFTTETTDDFDNLTILRNEACALGYINTEYELLSDSENWIITSDFNDDYPPLLDEITSTGYVGAEIISYCP